MLDSIMFIQRGFKPGLAYSGPGKEYFEIPWADLRAMVEPSFAERSVIYQMEKIKSSQSILIVGGGPTGVELAGEIAVYFPERKVTLVHNGPRLMEMLGAKAAKKTLVADIENSGSKIQSESRLESYC
ncbi:hypothetical protein ACET3Z_024899 [Daucus carota]